MSCYHAKCDICHMTYTQKYEDERDLPHCEECGSPLQWEKVDDYYCKDEIPNFPGAEDEEEKKSTANDDIATVSGKRKSNLYEVLKKKWCKRKII